MMKISNVSYFTLGKTTFDFNNRPPLGGSSFVIFLKRCNAQIVTGLEMMRTKNQTKNVEQNLSQVTGIKCFN